MPTDAHDLKATASLGSYSQETIVEILMQGSTIAGYYYSSSGQGPFWSDIGLSGVSVGGSCHGGLAVHFSASASYRYGPAYEGCPTPGSSSGTLTWSTIRKVSGNASALRSDLISDSCGGPCRKYEGGDQTVTVRRMPADLRLTPSHASLVEGQSASFIASPDPDSISSIKTPFRDISWQFKPDSATGGPICGAQSTCSFVPLGTGTITCNAEVNGASKARSARVLVVPCPTSDACLDEPSVRAGLRDAWARSRSAGREIGGVLYRRTTDGSCFYLEVTDPSAGPCHYNPPAGNNIPSFPDAYPIAYWHTHPNKTGEQVVCSSKKKGTAAPYSNGGGSGKLTDKKGDWANSKNAPVYAMAPAAVFRLNPRPVSEGGDGSSPQYNPNFWFWNTPQCKW